MAAGVRRRLAEAAQRISTRRAPVDLSFDPTGADLAPWREAANLRDVGARTADWLEGKLRHQPGCDLSGEDLERGWFYPQMLAGLVAANRVGALVSENSQPGVFNSNAYDGRPYRQRAYVSGFTNWPKLVSDEARRAGLTVHLHEPADPTRQPWSRTLSTPELMVVTEVSGNQPMTVKGRPLEAGDIELAWDDVGGPDHPAVQALLDAWQVTLIDATWGRNNLLWPTLERIARIAEGVS